MQRTAVKRAAIYVKANAGSSPEGAERETQMAESEGLCKDRGLDVAARYSDDPMSREEFQRMMADATSEHPPFDHVVVWKLRYFAWSLDESVLAREKAVGQWSATTIGERKTAWRLENRRTAAIGTQTKN